MELLAAVFRIEKFEPYVSGNQPFKVLTDCSAIAPLLRTKNPAGRLARWVMRLTSFTFEVVYRKGRNNVVEDHLSHYPIEYCEEPTTVPTAQLFFLPKVDISNVQRQDGFCEPIIRILEGPTDGENSRDKVLFYILKNRVLYREVESEWQLRLLLVVPEILRPDVLHEAHDSLCGGHLGISRTYERTHHRYFWPKCLNEVSANCASCVSCQSKKDPIGKPKGYLQPLPIEGPFLRVCIDFAGPFPISKRRNMHMIPAVEPFTKYISLPERFLPSQPRRVHISWLKGYFWFMDG